MEAPRTTPPPDARSANPPNDNIVSPENARVKRKRQPRNSACQPCASLKMKCATSQESDKCERCHRMNRECIPSVPKPRKRRTESNIGVGSAGSISVPGLVDGATATEAIQSLPISTGSKPNIFRHESPANALSLRQDIRHTGSRSFAALVAQGLKLDSLDSAHGDLLRGIDANFVQTSFTIFRQISGHFPFISILHGADSVAMVTQRPVTTLAVCTVAAAATPVDQERLQHAVRLSLASKAIVEGERNIDLLLGLLITIAWHHHFMVKQQIYQYLCLLAGMAADLGFHQSHDQNDTQYSAAIVERDRAFLGCYYTCSLLSLKGFAKPNPLPWTDKIRLLAENVGRLGPLQSDQNLVSHVELAHIVDDLNDALHTETGFSPQVYSLFVEMHAKAASHRLKSLKRDHPSLSSNFAFAAATIDVQQKLVGGSANSNTSALIQCACSIREYLDNILGRSPITMHQIAIVDWSNLLSILILMATVSRSLPSAGRWEAGALTSMLPADKILDAIATHMASAPHGDPLALRNEALVQWMQAFCGSVKSQIVDGQSSDDNWPAPSIHNGILDDSVLSSFMRPP